jgi:hypothetical protein
VEAPSLCGAAFGFRERAGRLSCDELSSGGVPAVRKVVDDLLERGDDLRWKVHELRDRAFLGPIISVLILGVALAVGLFVAIIATRGPSDYTTAAGFRYAPGPVTGDVVTRTVARDGKTRRVIRYRTRKGGVVYKRGRTLYETQTQVGTKTIASTVTQTATEVITVTEIEPVTVTVVETVTEPKSKP